MSIKRHFRSVAWLDKLVDLLVVILGISIAFGIDNWAEGRKNERAKQQYLLNLRVDLKKDSVSLQKNKEDLQEAQAAINTLLTLTNEPNPDKALTIARTLLVFGRGQLFEPEDYTYQSLQQTGDVNLLKNDSLQNTLSRLYDTYESIERQQDIFYQIQFDYVVPFYFNYDARRKIVADPEVYFQPKFSNVVLAASGNYGQRKGKNEEAIKYVNTLLSLIEKELAE